MEDSTEEEIFQYYTIVNDAENVENNEKEHSQVVYLAVDHVPGTGKDEPEDETSAITNFEVPEIPKDDIEKHSSLTSFGSNVKIITLEGEKEQMNQVVYLAVDHVPASTIKDEPENETIAIKNFEAPEIPKDDIGGHSGLTSFGSNVKIITFEDGRMLFLTSTSEDENFEAIEPHLVTGDSIKNDENETVEETENSNDTDTNYEIVQVVDNSSQMYQMVYCDVGSSNQQNCKKEKSYVCVYEGCGKMYTSAHHLNVHMRNHLGSKPYVCTEERCDKTFSTNYSLKAHIRTHTGEKPYSCLICQKCFKTCGDLQKHIRIHTGEKPFMCPIEGCGRSFTTSNIRKVHVRSHTGERPYSCDYPNCGKAFSSSTNYKNHIRIHSGEKPYACNVKGCGKRFTEYSSLYKHNLVHQPDKPYVCIFCGQKFKQDSTLNLHKRVKHNVIVASDGREIVILNTELGINK